MLMDSEAHQKVTTAHLSRLAYLYVRQSTLAPGLREHREHPPPVCAAGARRRAGLAARADCRHRQRPRAVRAPAPPTAKASSVW